MSKKKQKLTQSQSNGITCIAVLLAISLLLVFFSKKTDAELNNTDSIQIQNTQLLKKKEDSVYQSRRTQRRNYKTNNYTHRSKRPYPTQNPEHRNKSARPYSDNYYTTTPPAPTRKPLVVNLNDADTTTLMLLHGIGPTFASRIVRYRDRLGGFTHKEQLLEVYGFTPELLNHIAPLLSVDTNNIRHIAVNSVTLKEFIKHPYVDYYFARDLVNLRSRGVSFRTPDDLRAIPSCPDTLLAKLLPYLDFHR